MSEGPARGRDIDLGRPKAVGEVIVDALACYGAQPALFVGLTLLVVAPYGVIVRLAEGGTLLGGGHASSSATLVVGLINLLIVAPLISALHVHAVVELGAGRRPRAAAVLARGVRALPVVTAAEIVAGIATGIGLIAFIVPGLFLFACFAVVAQAAAIEGTDWMGALRRSAEITRGSRWHVLAVLLVVGLINSLIVNLCGELAGTGADAGRVVAGIAVETVVLSFGALTSAILYYDLRARRGEAGPAS